MPGRLSSEAAQLTADLLDANLASQRDFVVLFTAVVLDKLLAVNDSKLRWTNPDSYPPALASSRASGDTELLAAWIDADRSHRHRGKKVAVILGAMTPHDIATDGLLQVRHRAACLKVMLEDLGYRVHAPCAMPGSKRPAGEAADEDIVQVTIADLVVALSDPPALGVGILLGEAARGHPRTLIASESTTDLTPITSIVSTMPGSDDDQSPLLNGDFVPFLSEEELISEVRARVVARSADIERRHTKKIRNLEQKYEMFEEYRDSYSFAISSGIEIAVPDVLTYRVRLICTRIEVFATATPDELTDISEAINNALYGPEIELDDIANSDHLEFSAASDNDPSPPTANLVHPGTQDIETTELLAVKVVDLGVPAPAHSRTPDLAERERRLFDGVQFQQPVLFEGFTNVPQFEPNLPEGVSENLTPHELYFAEVARYDMQLSDADYAYMLQKARGERLLESVSSGASRLDFGSAPAWVVFWRQNLDRA
ncbi:hypothetical protein [Pengzhenrongella sicca]|uniref:Uncharacterized protein n=1 Tax=Pengzhenrongella sicca TaxID=2819238 RepID=A0A8A4ZDJ2_9MICO|nr:hypothetical protein [Pengzhenrongella sicca]QTE30050.1 hypothetical protein J4E96_03225 [Pengzhenrongella sicca]